MTPRPVGVTAETSLTETAAVMRDRGIGDVPVTRGDAALGIVTDRDITIRGVAAGLDLEHSAIERCCSSDPVFVAADDSISDVVRLFRECAIRRAPVVDHECVVGMVSLGYRAREHDSASALAQISSAPANT
jgi:predicted transcriptional regulator